MKDKGGKRIMKKQFTDEKTGIIYTLQEGDYYLPDLTVPEEPEIQSIGIYGKQHERYLKNHRKTVYTELLTSGRLKSYLADIDKQAQERFDLLVRQIAEREGITEKMKAENQMEWIGKMNNIRNRALEIVNDGIIYC